MRAFTAVLALLLLATVRVPRAHAGDDGDAEPDAVPVPMQPIAQWSVAEHRSPTTAFVLSAGGTLLGAAMIAGGTQLDRSGSAQQLVFDVAGTLVIAGPSFGHWYAGHGLTLGMGGRALGLATIELGLLAGSVCDGGSCDGPDTVVYVGLGVFAAGTLWDIATAPGAAREWNRKHALQVIPAPLSTVGGPAPGLVLSGTF